MLFGFFRGRCEEAEKNQDCRCLLNHVVHRRLCMDDIVFVLVQTVVFVKLFSFSWGCTGLSSSKEAR